MNDAKLIKRGALSAALAVLYIAVVATLMSNAERLFGEQKPSILAPIVILSLLVVSAATMGMLVFGKPVMLYMDGKKREAIKLVTWTIGSLAALTILGIAILAMSRP